MGFSSINRADQWAKDAASSNDILKTLRDGILPTINANDHDFRPRDKVKELTSKVFYPKHYLPAGERAELAQKDCLDSQLGADSLPKDKGTYKKPRDVEKEMGPELRHGCRTELERLADHLNGANRLLDTTGKDTTMINSPSWRSNAKERWISPRGFGIGAVNYIPKRVSDPWQTTPLRVDVNTPYVNGLEARGNVFRDSQKSLNIIPKDFSSTISPSYHSPNNASPHKSYSLRANFAEKFFDNNNNACHKMYANTLRQVNHNHDGPNTGDILTGNTSSQLSPKPKIVVLKAESIVDFAKGPVVMEDTGTENHLYHTLNGFKGSPRKSKVAKDLPKPNNGLRIKQVIENYFDN